MPAFDAPAQSFANLSHCVAGELSDLCTMVDQLQPVLSALVAADSDPLDPAHSEKLQTLDYISQHLKALADFLIVLAGEGAAQTAVDAGRALSIISLSDLRERLLQSTYAPAVEADDDDPAWELF